MSRSIPLLRGQSALVDDSDYPWLSQYRFRLNDRGYAVRSFMLDGRQVTIGMHREIMQPPSGYHVDHRDHDPLNNTRSNLRLATRQQNMENRQRFKNNLCGFKGVTALNGKWHVRIQLGRLINLGSFEALKDAALAYDYAAGCLFGEFALLNLPNQAIPPAVQEQVERALARAEVGQETRIFQLER